MSFGGFLRGLAQGLIGLALSLSFFAGGTYLIAYENAILGGVSVLIGVVFAASVVYNRRQMRPGIKIRQFDY